jgi:hypothetical protein
MWLAISVQNKRTCTMTDIDLNAEIERIFSVGQADGNAKYSQAEKNDAIFLILSAMQLSKQPPEVGDLEASVFADVLGRAMKQMDAIRPGMSKDKSAVMALAQEPSAQQALVVDYFDKFPPREDLWREIELLMSRVRGGGAGIESMAVSAGALAAVGSQQALRAPKLGEKKPEGTFDVGQLAPRRRV